MFGLAVSAINKITSSVFWAKSLEGLRAMVPLSSADRFRVSDEEPRHIEQSLALAPKLEPIIGALNEEAASATL